MERILQKLVRPFLASILLLLASSAFAQSAGFNTTFIVLSINNGANAFYDLQGSTPNPDFNNANLGSFCQGSTTGIVFKGAEHNVYKCGGCDITSTRIYYRIYPTASPSGTFVSNNIGFTSDFANGCGGRDQKWSNTGYATNLLAGLSAGNYTLEVYSDESTSCFGTVYASNGSANYKATFTVNANVTYYADADGDGFGNAAVSQVSCTGTPAGYVTNNLDCNDNLITYADADGDGFGSTTKVACGVTNNSDCNDAQFQYLDADGDGFGSTTKVACGVTNNSDCNDNQITYADVDGDGFGSTTKVACGVANNSDCNDAQLQYVDADGDGFGSITVAACGVTNNSDCNDAQFQYLDADGDGFGSTTKVACGVTNNSDCNDAQLQYVDADGDGFGSTTVAACGVTNNSDCNDSNAAAHSTFSFYVDADGDSYGAGSLLSGICATDGSTPPTGYSLNNTDCNDADASIFQSGTLYVDADNDGYNNGSTAVVCYGATVPSGYAAANNGLDCNDAVAAINPGHAEVL
ncbi:MAG TPA: hypothetical protein VGB50_10120, partial [Flavobacterium sp.]